MYVSYCWHWSAVRQQNKLVLLITPHRRTTYADATYCYTRDRVAWPVVLSLTVVSPPKTDEPIEMSFGLWTRVGQGSMYYAGCTLHTCPTWRIPLNRPCDAAFLSNFFDHLLNFVAPYYLWNGWSQKFKSGVQIDTDEHTSARMIDYTRWDVFKVTWPL